MTFEACIRECVIVMAFERLVEGIFSHEVGGARNLEPSPPSPKAYHASHRWHTWFRELSIGK